MTDAADRAADLEAAERDSALAKRAVRRREAPRTIGGARVCLDCEEAIEAQRLTANPQAVRCVECQQLRERGGC